MINMWDTSSFILYLSILFCTIFFSSINSEDSYLILSANYKRSYKRAFFVVFIIWITILSFRDLQCGTDLGRYIEKYDRLHINSISEWLKQSLSTEPLFTGYTATIKALSSTLSRDQSIIIYLFSVAAIWIILSFKAIANESEKNGITTALAVLMIQMFFRSFSMIRQCIALGIMFLAFSEYARGRKKIYWILLCVALGFHYSAIIGIPAYFFVTVNGSNKTIILKRIAVIMCMILFFLFGAEILDSVFGSSEDKYALLGKRSSSIGLGQLAKRLPFIFVLLYFKQSLIEQNEHNKVYIDLMIFDVFVGQLNYVNPSFNRMSLYFDLITVFLVPSLAICLSQKIGKSSSRIFFLIIIIGWYISKVYYYTYDNPYGIMPYVSTLK